MNSGALTPQKPDATALQKPPEPALDHALAVPDTDYRRSIRLGMWILLAGFGGFLLWALLAPLDEGVPAPGVVSVESVKKRIDHLTGGIIEKILVREGQAVREGDELIIFNETQAKAALGSTHTQWRIAQANEARLNAERTGVKSVAFPPDLVKAAEKDPEIAAALRTQTELFFSRRTALAGELRIIQESIRGLEFQLRSLDQLKVGREKQVQLFNEQLASFTKLHSQGFVSRNQLLEIERQLAEVQSKQSEDMANIAGINARLAEFRMRGAQREIEYKREVETQLTAWQRELAAINEKLTTQQDTHDRLKVRAPVSGIVVDLAYHTVGGIIKPGDRIMDIVPQDDALIVEAQLPPQYIDRVHPGLPADMHFDAYMSRAERPVIRGKVVVVSADALTDPRSGGKYYSMRVSVPGEELRKLGDLKLQPGMQGTVMVKTGERSLMVYLLRPLLRRFSSALGER
jgi:HlyD family type I secretion membrane fusion protein